jgi:hypothetical protein
VDVVEDDHRRRPPAELARERSCNLVGLRAAGHQLLELAARGLGDLEEGAERPGREERVAVAPENARRTVLVAAEAAQQRRLADPRLTADEHEPPAAPARHFGAARIQPGQVLGPLEQLARIARGTRCRFMSGCRHELSRPVGLAHGAPAG